MQIFLSLLHGYKISWKRSSERESKIFSSSLVNEGLAQAIFAVKRTLEWSKKDF